MPALLILNLRPLLAVVALVSLIGWCGGAAVLWQLLHLRGYPSIAYLDLLLPARWSRIGPAQAEDLLVRARRATVKGDMLKGLWLGKAALRKDPRRAEAYELVGLICARNWLMAEARETLSRGLEVGVPSHRYLKLQLDVAQAADDTATVLDLTERFWRDRWRNDDRDSRLLLAVQRARALLQQQRWAEALAWARELRALQPQPIALVDVEAFALLQLGRPQEARDLLAALPLDFARRHDGVIRLLAEVYHRLGNPQACRQAMRYYLDHAGGQPARHLDVLGYCRSQPDLQDDYREGLESYFAKFGASEEAMGLLAEFLLHNRALSELDRLYVHAQGHLFQAGSVDIAYAQALLFAGEEQRASAILDRLPRLPENTTFGVRVQFLRRLLTTRATEMSNASVPLTNYLAEHPLPLDEALNLFDLFYQRGRLDDAGLILDLTARNYPNSQRLIERTEQLKRGRTMLGQAAV